MPRHPDVDQRQMGLKLNDKSERRLSVIGDANVRAH